LWLYDKGTLTSFGEHYQTGEQIPDELFDELIKERLNRSSLRLLNQVFQGQLELELYDTKHSNQSVLQILEDCSNRFVLPSTKNKNRKEVDLSQVIDLFVDGTPEFRYRYLVSEIMSCDAFAAFEEVGLSNDASVKVLGRKFRKMILATGGGLKASDAYHRFRGRDFQTDAFFRHNGLV
jgi:oligopeptidase A